MQRYIKWAIALLGTLIATPPRALAHCPLCTIAAGAGLGISRGLGVDDGVIGLFFGAFIASSALWLSSWLGKKVEMPMLEMITLILSFLLSVVPLYLAGIITNIYEVMKYPQTSLLGLGYLGIDRLLAGIILGTIGIAGAFKLSDWIKKKRGKVMWSYQGLSFMAAALIILTSILLVIT